MINSHARMQHPVRRSPPQRVAFMKLWPPQAELYLLPLARDAAVALRGTLPKLRCRLQLLGSLAPAAVQAGHVQWRHLRLMLTRICPRAGTVIAHRQNCGCARLDEFTGRPRAAVASHGNIKCSAG